MDALTQNLVRLLRLVMLLHTCDHQEGMVKFTTHIAMLYGVSRADPQDEFKIA